MSRFGKRILALCCCLFLMAALAVIVTATPAENCSGGCEHKAAIDTTHYDTLAEAISAAADDSTVVLLADTTVTEPLVIEKLITLDLGGNTLTGQTDGSMPLISAAKDCVINNGAITADVGIIVQAENCALTLEKDARLTGKDTEYVICVLSADSGTSTLYIQEDAQITAEENHAICMEGAGRLEIAGGTIQAKKDAITLNIAEKMTMEASITGGKILAEDGQVIVINQGTDAIAPTDFIIGGTYNKIPTDFVPDYCRTTDNGDGTFTVTAEYTVSFGANGGSGTMQTIKTDRGTEISLPQCTLTAPAGKHFKAWEIDGKAFAPGASYTVEGDLNLNAIWADHTGGSATCVKKAVCSVCGVSYGSLAGHKLSVSNGYDATCTAQGMVAHSKCIHCGQHFADGVPVPGSTLTLPKLGHDMVAVEGTAPTCTTEGLLAHEVCTVCGFLQADKEPITEDQLVLPLSGHTLEAVSPMEPTCTQPGVIAHERCAHCDLLFLNGQEITADAASVAVSAHVLSDWQNDETTHWKACVDCSQIFRQHSHADADSNTVCDECGYQLPVAQAPVPVEESSSFSWLFLIPMAVAVAIGVGVAINTAKKKAK